MSFKHQWHRAVLPPGIGVANDLVDPRLVESLVPLVALEDFQVGAEGIGSDRRK